MRWTRLSVDRRSERALEVTLRHPGPQVAGREWRTVVDLLPPRRLPRRHHPGVPRGHRASNDAGSSPGRGAGASYRPPIRPGPGDVELGHRGGPGAVALGGAERPDGRRHALGVDELSHATMVGSTPRATSVSGPRESRSHEGRSYGTVPKTCPQASPRCTARRRFASLPATCPICGRRRYIEPYLSERYSVASDKTAILRDASCGVARAVSDVSVLCPPRCQSWQRRGCSQWLEQRTVKRPGTGSWEGGLREERARPNLPHVGEPRSRLRSSRAGT
jgi:hypothetical protein